MVMNVIPSNNISQLGKRQRSPDKKQYSPIDKQLALSVA